MEYFYRVLLRYVVIQLEKINDVFDLFVQIHGNQSWNFNEASHGFLLRNTILGKDLEELSYLLLVLAENTWVLDSKILDELLGLAHLVA